MPNFVTEVHPHWLDTIVPDEYEDEGLYEIILFFVIHSPCPGQSAKGISLTDRGWKENPWYSPEYLRNRLDRAVFGKSASKEEINRLKMVESKSELYDALESVNLDGDFFNRREQQRALYVKSSAKGCNNKYMSLFYHIRNSLAHGRLAMYPAVNDIVFVMEDGRETAKKADGQFEVSARIIIFKSALLKIINVLTNPPAENDYTDDILRAIKDGCCTKKKIIDKIGIKEMVYERYIQKMKLNNRIKYANRKWVIR